MRLTRGKALAVYAWDLEPGYWIKGVGRVATIVHIHEDLVEVALESGELVNYRARQPVKVLLRMTKPQTEEMRARNRAAFDAWIEAHQ